MTPPAIHLINALGGFSSYLAPLSPPGINMINNLVAQGANYHLTRSGPYQVGNFDLLNGAIMNINGISNSLRESTLSSTLISKYAQGAKVYGIYNATNTFAYDIQECALGRIGIHTMPVQHLKTQWAEQIMRLGPDAKILQICHSGGAEHVKNALLTSSEVIRQKIIVLALAPSVIVPNELCFRSYNYISRRDVVTHLDIVGKARYGNELRILDPHPNAKRWDHEFASPTFTDVMEEHVSDYIRKYRR